jgi:hypothetical protein
MIRIAGIHMVDSITGRRHLNLNREWIEIANFGQGPQDIYGSVIVTSRGEKAVLEPKGYTALILDPGKVVLVFSGRPDVATDPPGVFMETEAERFFLSRTRPLFDREQDAAFLYPSMSAYLADASAYIDAFHFSRHNQAKQILGV